MLVGLFPAAAHAETPKEPLATVIACSDLQSYINGKYGASDPALIKEIFENMEYIYVPGAADRMDGLFLRLLEETTLAVIRMKTESAEDPVIYEVISYLNAHFMDGITLEDVCRKYSLSRRTLYRRWSECFDHTPAEFLLRKRLDYADQLLLTSDLSIQTVAERSGFRNPIYFTQCYRRAFGLSPTRRRKEEKRVRG